MKNDLIIRFHVEHADRSVGIMSEDFSAWVVGAENDAWCSVLDVVKKDFQWYDGNGDLLDRLQVEDAIMVEEALHAFALAWYKVQEQGLSYLPSDENE